MAAQVPNQIKQQRLEKLMLTQQKIAFAKNESRTGSELICLVDSADDRGSGRGRFYGQAPDIDGVCIIRGCQIKTGEFVNTRVAGTKNYDLVVDPVRTKALPFGGAKNM
jgi:ribosomal protein S12 methylthiotransferase